MGKMRFAIAELAYGMVVKTSRNFERLRREVEGAEPERWFNPILVVLPSWFRSEQEEGEIHQLQPLEDWVVAIPKSGWGYGAEFIGYINANRRKFGLPGTFTPSEDVIDVIEFRKKLTEMGPGRGIHLLSISGDLTESLDREEKFKLGKGILETREEYEDEENAEDTYKDI